jgi:hypothetical protein
MASFSSFWFTDFEVPPLHVPESSPAQRAQPRHPEQTQSGALMDTPSDGGAEHEHSLDVGSRNPRVETDARNGERTTITSLGPEVETDARTGERVIIIGQHAPIGGRQNYVWSHPIPTWPMHRGVDHAQNEFVTEATSDQLSMNSDEVTQNAAESDVSTQEPHRARYPYLSDLAHTPPVEVSTRNLPVRHPERVEPSRPAIKDHTLITSLRIPEMPIGHQSTFQRTQTQSKEHQIGRPMKHLPPVRPEPHQRSPPDVYKPSRTPRSESPVRLEPSDSISHISSTPESRPRREDSTQSGIVRIRDDSRARSVVPVGLSGEICEICLTCGHQRHYCNVCTVVFCDSCWETQFLHRMKRFNPGLPHEKTDPYVAKKIGGVLNPQLKEEQREQLHHDDIDTTWFGVEREGHERPMFQDYGRYADLVAGVKDLRLGSVSTLSESSDHSEALYPSLVSFVGETGAGKSSLIKLIIDLKSDEDEPFETPVVGAAGRDVATSEDVHLYLDPESSESQAPLLFADCEGLNGGERDPVGARLKRKMVPSQKSKSGGRRKPTSERELVWADTAKKQSRDFAVAHLYPRLLYTFSDVIVFVVKNPR